MVTEKSTHHWSQLLTSNDQMRAHGVLNDTNYLLSEKLHNHFKGKLFLFDDVHYLNHKKATVSKIKTDNRLVSLHYVD